MSYLFKDVSRINLQFKVMTRAICCTQNLGTREWRYRKGLPFNKNSTGPLTDNPDYKFLDGRPTPLLHKQKQRLLLQQQFAEKIVEYNSHIEFAIQREKDAVAAKEQEKQNVIKNRLKPKGNTIFNKT